MPKSTNAFPLFMARPAGRILRIIAGLALIAWGWSRRGDTTGMVVMGVGLLPLLAGVFNLCVIAPLIGAPFSGRAALDADNQPSRRI